MKKITSLFLVIIMIIVQAVSVSAASYSSGYQTGTITTKTPTNITYSDISRLAEIATQQNSKQAIIVNATRYNGSSTTWIVRLAFGGSEYTNAADYVLNVLPYSWDANTNTVVSLPFKSIEEGTTMYGSSWYYFGVFDDINHNICGFVVAERINRWPAWNDLKFSGVNKRGIGYTGSYTEPCSDSFIESHINRP